MAELEERMERFRRQLESHFGGQPGRGARYPATLRAEAVAVGRRGMEGGASLSCVAGGLGIGRVTLSRWLESPVAADWRPVEVVSEPPVAAAAVTVSEGLVWITPRGHRLEGLSVTDAAVLLAALG
jgi:hypothetical protein